MPEAHIGMMVTPSVKLVRPLGEGGMGAVWVADHLSLRTQVVVKFIASGLKDNKEATERFSREAAAASQVKSPHVVQTFDHGFTADGIPYIVMELLEGRDLGEFLDKEKVCSPSLALEIVVQLARALDRAHARGIIHRDIKPGNIFLCDGGRGEVFVKLLDFGIAKGVEMPAIDSTTKTGVMIGSPFYMSPEQILGTKNIDHHSDLWSVGVVAYEALTGQKPFDAETMGGLAIRIHSEPLPVPSSANRALSPAVDAWFLRACARPAPDRFHSGRDLAEALGAALGGEMPRSVDLPSQTPRSSTGANDGRAANATEMEAIASGTTTLDASSRIVPAQPHTARNRVVAVSLFAVVLALGTFGVVKVIRSGNAVKNGAAVTSEPAVSARPPPEAPPTIIASAALSQAPPVPVLTEIPSASVAPPTPKLVGHVPPRLPPRPAGSSPSAHPPLPSSTASPAGHDIF